MAPSQDGERMPDDAWPEQPGGQDAGDWATWYAPGSERVGRHGATAPDLNETLLLPPLRLPGAATTDETGRQPDLRPAGRHASAQHASASTPQPSTARQPEEPGPQTVSDPVPGTANGTSRAVHGSSAAARDTSKLRLVWVYPDLLSTYGDRGNLLVLTRRARLRGIEVEAVEVNSDQPVPRQGDIYLLGGGEDLPQILAANRLRADGGLAAAGDRGGVIFAVCAGYQLLGDQFGGVEGEPVTGLGVLDISSGRGERRGVGEIVGDVDPELGVPRITGFENHQGVTKVGAGARPLATVTLGVGNGDGTEGAYAGRVLGTYMHGPALARNPGLADLLLSWVTGPLEPPDTDAEEWARQLRAERLAASRQSVDQRLRALGHNLGDKGRGARDADAIGQVILGNHSPRCTLTTEGNGAAFQHSVEQVSRRSGVGERKVRDAVRSGEPGSLPGQPE